MLTPCDSSMPHHKCMPCANTFREEALFSSVLFSLREPTPVHYVWVWCVSWAHSHETAMKSGRRGELRLCIFKHEKDVTWYLKNLGCNSVAISGLVYSCFIILLFVLTDCAIVCWWESFHAGRPLWGTSRISDKWSCPWHSSCQQNDKLGFGPSFSKLIGDWKSGAMQIYKYKYSLIVDSTFSWFSGWVFNDCLFFFF